MFGLVYPVNMESYNGLLKFKRRTESLYVSIFTLIYIVVFIQLIKMITGAIGYFNLHVKSYKVFNFNIISNATLILLRGIVCIFISIYTEKFSTFISEYEIISEKLINHYIVIMIILSVFDIFLFIMNIMQNVMLWNEYKEFKAEKMKIYENNTDNIGINLQFCDLKKQF